MAALPTMSGAQTNEGIDVAIRLYDADIYTTADDIHIEVRVRNDSPTSYRFSLANERIFNLNFRVQTMTNQSVPEADRFIRVRSTSQAVFYREIVLESGEEYSFVENLRDYVELPRPGMYVVSAEFFPDLFEGRGRTTLGENQGGARNALFTNRLTVNVRPEGLTQGEIAQARVDQETREILRRRPLPPDDIVRQTIQARQQENWGRFFLYMDLESIYRRGAARERQFVNMSEQQQQEALMRFRDQLADNVISEDIVAMPSSFEIVQTSYTPDFGTVVATLRFRNPSFTDVKQYTYRLRRVDDTWEIYDYSVQNLGTEANQ
jgi:hypothetical protein